MDCVFKRSIIIPFEISQIKEIQEIAIERLTNKSGIYFLCRNAKIMYIGKSINVIRRVMDHFYAESKIFDSAFYIPFMKDQLDYYEFEFIKRIKPPLNSMSVKYPKEVYEFQFTILEVDNSRA